MNRSFNTSVTTIICAFTAMTAASFAIADDPVFEVSAFIAGIEGEGFIGNINGEDGATWEFPAGQSGSYYVNSLDDMPIEFVESATGPLGGESRGGVQCTAEATLDTVSVRAVCGTFVDGGPSNEYGTAYGQAHGEFHIQINKPSLVVYDLCNDTTGSSAWGQLFLRKLVNGNFQTMVKVLTSSDAGAECLEGEVNVEPGLYQLWFSAMSNINNTAEGYDLDIGFSDSRATLTITAINVADINGDGVVDGADLTRLLGAWGTSASGGDLDGDGDVDGADLAILLGAWS